MPHKKKKNRKKVLLMGTALALLFIVYVIQMPKLASGFLSMHTSDAACLRILTELPRLKLNHPLYNRSTDSSFYFKNYTAIAKQTGYRSATVSFSNAATPPLVYKYSLEFIPTTRADSMLVVYRYPLSFTQKIGWIFGKRHTVRYQLIHDYLVQMQQYMEHTEQLYGVSIVLQTSPVEHLICYKYLADRIENTQVYFFAEQLRRYANQFKATQTDSFFFHFETTVQPHTIQIAVPIDRPIPFTKNYFYKHMVRGNMLSTKVTGGFNQIDEAIKGMYQYVQDYNLSMPAVPFEQWKTNRITTPDSSLWQTVLYFPIL